MRCLFVLLVVSVISGCCVVGQRYETLPTVGWRESNGVFHKISDLPEHVKKAEDKCYDVRARIDLNNWCMNAEKTGNYKNPRPYYVSIPNETEMKDRCAKRLPLPENLTPDSFRVENCMKEQGYFYETRENWSCTSPFKFM